MKPILITVKNEIGRDRNPHLKYTDGTCDNPEWWRFDKNTPSHPAPDFEDGEYLAELRWQVYDSSDRKWIEPKSSVHIKLYQSDGHETRRIWVKAIDVEGEKETEIKNHFYLSTNVGIIHVNMDQNADPEVFEAVKKMAELVFKKL